MKKISRSVLAMVVLILSGTRARAEQRHDLIEIVTTTTHSDPLTTQSTVMDGDIFRRAIQSAILEMQGGLSGTCAKEMVVSIRVEAKGNWKIVEVGVTGTVQIRILNPSLPSNCAR